MVLLGVIALSIYLILVVWVNYHWRQPLNTHSPILLDGATIIVPGRNEADIIEPCLQSCKSQQGLNFPAQLIFVDDHSEDDTLMKAKGKRGVAAYANKGTGKKDALKTGVAYANNEVLLFTDADCIVPRTWAKTMMRSLKENNKNMVTGVVRMIGGDTLIEEFQKFDNANTMAFTNAGVKTHTFYAANGANIIVTKEKYNQVISQPDYKNFASGDDMYLIQSLASEDAHQVGFNNNLEAFVDTPVVKSSKSFWQQRKRWATKSLHLPNTKLTYIQAFSLFFHAFILGLLFAGIFFPNLLYLFSAVLLGKLLLDYWYFWNLSDDFHLNMSILTFLKVEIYYFIYIFRMAYYAVFGSKYEWKDRRVT